MIDGLTFKYIIKDFEEWRRSVKIRFITNVDTLETGEISTKKRNNCIITTYRGTWETFDLIVKEVLHTDANKKFYYLKVKGSLHKNFYKGTNYLPFTWQQLQKHINHVCCSLHLNPFKVKISGMEIGVNIVTPFEVTPFVMASIINYKGNTFNRYNADAKGICLGIVCNLTQYAVKIYDKGVQNNLSYNLMRFELKYSKMQVLKNRGIKYLSDLQNLNKIYTLLELLETAWEGVLIFDVTIPIKTLSIEQEEKELLIEGQNPVFWELLKQENTGDHFKYQRAKFRNLVAITGNHSQTLVRDLLFSEWRSLFENSPNLPTGKTDSLPEFTIKIKGKNGEKSFTPQKRYCLSCGNELHPDQKSNSKFCSSKFVGEAAAHQCRNISSNARNNFKRKVKTIENRGVLFDILPYFTQRVNRSSPGPIK